MYAWISCQKNFLKAFLIGLIVWISTVPSYADNPIKIYVNNTPLQCDVPIPKRKLHLHI